MDTRPPAGNDRTCRRVHRRSAKPGSSIGETASQVDVLKKWMESGERRHRALTPPQVTDVVPCGGKERVAGVATPCDRGQGTRRPSRYRWHRSPPGHRHRLLPAEQVGPGKATCPVTDHDEKRLTAARGRGESGDSRRCDRRLWRQPSSRSSPAGLTRAEQIGHEGDGGSFPVYESSVSGSVRPRTGQGIQPDPNSRDAHQHPSGTDRRS